MTVLGSNYGSFFSSFCWERVGELRNQYGDFAITLEVLNQFSVRGTRLFFCKDMLDGERFIPASIRDLVIDDFANITDLHGCVEKVADFYKVSICGEDSYGNSSRIAVIYVALVTEDG
ncbi:hypothetical protein V6259_19275 [Marinomonas sp. TI.3.20]|uniref:hypothetical protein n=1 Tax=Marinomonas sp. TI.3.20 TaxID=3121296 RepID=UPI00311DAB95